MSASSATFSELVGALINEDLPVNVDQWCTLEYIDKYRRFFILLGDALEFFSRDTAAEEINTDDAKRLLDLLYATALSAVIRLSISHPNAKDVYMDCPLTNIYLGIACCLLHLREHTLYTGRRDLFFDEQQNIDYCMRYRLDVKHHVPISHFSFEDLALSLLKLERSLFALSYHSDLELYVDALDVRLCELISHTNCEAMLDNPEYSTSLSNVGSDEHYCSTSGEYYLIVSILAIRKSLTSALPRLREDAVQRVLERDEDKRMLKHLQQVFLTKCRNVHSDDVDNAFAERYKELMTFISEVFLFLKLNGPDTRPDHASIVTQFRNRTYWDNITNVAHSSIDQYLEYPDRNCVAFRVLFMQMAELLFQQQLQISWTQFCLDGEQIYKMDNLAYDDFVKLSHAKPFFVQSLNDACIFFRGQLFVFGKESQHYLHAFKEWLDIVNTEMHGVINDCQTIRPLLEYIIDEDASLRIHVQSGASSSTDEGHQFSTQKQRDQQHDFRTFKYILSGITSDDQSADASNTIGIVEGSGVENSSMCGWV